MKRSRLAVLLLWLLMRAKAILCYSEMRVREIIACAANPKKGVSRNFLATIRAVGRAGDRVYLNLQDDYCDQCTMSILLMPSVHGQLVSAGFRRNRSRASN